ncbi:hypothetical protein HAX54_045002 [Datura stramonium]|uniref:Uncharacterized protein n=1 Tax=Datura stramonium TaxID=4076 RepID=A0ABS8WHJ5_DATST|nr:hypothetical protein [Datura stramonium]
MAESDAEYNEEVNFLNLQKNLKTLSQKEWRLLENVLIDAYYDIVSEKDTLDAELDQSERSIPGERPGEQAKQSDHAGQDSSVELKPDRQEPGTPSGTSRNDHQWDVATNNPNYSQKEGHNNEEALDTTTPINQQRQDSSVPRVSNWKHKASHPLDNIISSLDQSITTRSGFGNQNPDNLILDTPISSNTPHSPTHTGTKNSLSLNIPVVRSEGTSMQHPFTEEDVSVIPVNLNEAPNLISQEINEMVQPNGVEEQGTGVVCVTPVAVLEIIEAQAKEGSNLSNETLFEGSLLESNEGTSNILKNEEEIIEEFITTMDTRFSEIGEKTPPAEWREYETTGEKGS